MRQLDGVLPSGVSRRLGDATHGGGPGDVFVRSKGYRQVADPSARAQTWSTGPVEVAKSLPHMMVKGTLLERPAALAQAAGSSRRCTSPASWTSCSSRSAGLTCSASPR